MATCCWPDPQPDAQRAVNGVEPGGKTKRPACDRRLCSCKHAALETGSRPCRRRLQRASETFWKVLEERSMRFTSQWTSPRQRTKRIAASPSGARSGRVEELAEFPCNSHRLGCLLGAFTTQRRVEVFFRKPTHPPLFKFNFPQILTEDNDFFVNEEINVYL